MIKSISFIVNNQTINYLFDRQNLSKTIIECQHIIGNSINSFDIEIIFDQDIQLFRNHDYSWQTANQDFVAGQFCPKIIRLSNGFYVQANINLGIWEINKSKKSVLLWRFNPNNASVVTQYSTAKNIKSICDATVNLNLTTNPALLFTKNPLEFSRSPIAFSGIACFTDHCDFDTLQNLQKQRELFKQLNIKTTKGFFLYHFSKRDDNASYEKNAIEIDLWRNDGHELCYHSLSQSIKPTPECINDFKNFEFPFEECKVWIDHGFQPYNFSMFKKSGIENKVFEEKLYDQKVNTLWNYIDSGTSTTGVINQLNNKHFTLNQYWKSLKDQSLLNKLISLFKNIVFHSDNNAHRVRNYIDSITAIKQFLKTKNLFRIIDFIKNFLPIFIVFFRTILFWNTDKNKTYKYAKYQSIFFKHKIFNLDFFVFQTIEMIDFKKALQKNNIDLLINEAGIFIAHTYFSANAKHYSGKLFAKETILDPEVVANFKYLSKKITENKIWNPTLSQLINYWIKLEKIVFDIDKEGQIITEESKEIIFRKVE